MRTQRGSKWGRGRWCLLTVTAYLFGLAIAGCAAEPETFTVKEWVGLAHHNERVSFPLSAAQLAQAKAGDRLLGPGGQAVTYQLIPGQTAQDSRIEFAADLEPFESAVYSFGDGQGEPVTDLTVQDRGETIELSNGLIGIVLNKRLEGGVGPVARLQLTSGKLVGGSLLQTDQPVTDYKAMVTARGPVYAEVMCRAEFGDKGSWAMRFQLQANEPVIRVDEWCKVQGAQVELRLFPDRNFGANKILFKTGNNEVGKNKIDDVKPGTVFTWEPRLFWAYAERRGQCFTLFNPNGPDALSFGAGWAGRWVDPQIPWAERTPGNLTVTKDDQGLWIPFPVRRGQRMWIITALSTEEALTGFSEEEYFKTLPAYAYLIKHGQFPLDVTKDYQYTWQGAHDNYPRLLLTQDGVKRFRENLAEVAPYERAAAGYVAQAAGGALQVQQYNMGGPISAYLATGDEAMGKVLGDVAEDWLLRVIRRVVMQPDMPYGSAPHHFQEIGSSILLCDVALSNPKMDPVLRERMLAQIAFMCYTISRSEFWSEERGFSGTANMSTSVYGYQVTAACAISSHPLAKSWARDGLERLKNQVDTWSDDHGGWLEAPHYAMVSLDQILSCFVMANNAGFNDYLYDPRMKAIMNWFSKIATPPDSRLNGYRHQPPVGHTYLREPCGEFGIVAALWRDKDPEFSAQMQWMWRQQWSYKKPGIGGSAPGFAGFREIIADPTLPEKAPPWTSEWFPETGVILRNVFPSDRETTLYMIAGNNHQHYDDDSGSVTIWGKGRIIADDFAYGTLTRPEHSLPETPLAQGIMSVKEYLPGERLDYVRGISNAWTRQVAFVKDSDPLGPNYFVLCDSFPVATTGTWRLWLTAKSVTPQGQAAVVEGADDVDTDIFFALPNGVKLSTEEKTLAAGSGMYPDGHWSGMSSTQTALIAPFEGAETVTALVYPRLKNEAPPRMTALAGGKGIKVESPVGTDYVFLSPTRFEYQEGDVSFEGTVGVAQIRDGKATLSLGAPGRLSAAGQSAEKAGQTFAATWRPVMGGDFESGQQELFVVDSRQYGCTATLHEGNPVPGDGQHQGKFCVAVRIEGKSGVCISPKQIYVDARKTYRVKMSYYTTSNMSVGAGGYGRDLVRQITDDKGNTWGWSVDMKGPVDGWMAAETTIGPPGSGAKYIWPPGVISTFMNLWISGDPGAVLYLDDITWEEVQ